MNLSNSGKRYYDCKTLNKKRTDSMCVFTRSGKIRKGVIHRMITKQRVTNK